MTKEKKWIDDWFRWMMKVHTILLSSGVFESSLVCRNHMSMKWAIQLIDCNDKGYKHWYQDLLICHALFCSNNPRKIVKDLVNLFWSVSAFKLISNWFVKRQEKLWVETGVTTKVFFSCWLIRPHVTVYKYYLTRSYDSLIPILTQPLTLISNLIRSDSLLTDPYPIWLITYWSLSDLTHYLLILIQSDSFAYWCSLSSLLIFTQLAYWWSTKLADSYSFPCI